MTSVVMDEIMGGETTQSQIASYLTALHMKGGTIDEITASAGGMKTCIKNQPFHGCNRHCRDWGRLCSFYQYFND